MKILLTGNPDKSVRVTRFSNIPALAPGGLLQIKDLARKLKDHPFPNQALAFLYDELVERGIKSSVDG